MNSYKVVLKCIRFFPTYEIIILFIKYIYECLINDTVYSIIDDDVVIYVTGDNVQNITLNYSVNKLNSWYKKNRLGINISETRNVLILIYSDSLNNCYIHLL